MTDVSRETSRLRDYERYLAGPGIERGLVGPREADRLWSRHVLNCAVVAWDLELVPPGATVVDVGSGAGLPGVVWALARPDLRVTVVDSLQRRTTFLTEAVRDFELSDRVTVLRARAETLPAGRWEVATARAVAPLPRLLPLLAPLARPGGTVLAFKGETAAQEVAEAAEVAAGLGLTPGEIRTVEAGRVEQSTIVVRYRSGTRTRGRPRRAGGAP